MSRSLSDADRARIDAQRAINHANALIASALRRAELRSRARTARVHPGAQPLNKLHVSSSLVNGQPPVGR